MYMATPACAGAVSLKSGGFETQHNRTTGETQHQPGADERTKRLVGPRFERLVERVHSLGPRVFAELLGDIARSTGQDVLIAHRLEKYACLDPAVLRDVGADRFPPMPLGVVP